MRKWFLDCNNVVAFIDGFSGAGFSRSTTAVKLSQIPSRNAQRVLSTPPPVRTVLEWRGDESLMSTWLPIVNALLVQFVVIMFLIVDQKAAIYVLNHVGSNSKKAFIFSKRITREMWTDVKNFPFVDKEDTSETGLTFLAGIIDPSVPECFKLAAVVPPFFHMYVAIQQYVIETFCAACEFVDTHQFFDILSIREFSQNFHGRPFQSGEARRAISWAEVILRKTVVPNISSEVLMIFALAYTVIFAYICPCRLLPNSFRFYRYATSSSKYFIVAGL